MYTSKTSGWGAITEQVEGRACEHTYLEGVVEGGFGFAAEVGGVRGEAPLGGTDGVRDGGGEGASHGWRRKGKELESRSA